MKRIIPIIISALAAMVAVMSCDEGSVGQSISQSSVSVIVDSTFEVKGRSVKSMVISARTSQQMLGLVKASGFGVLESDFVTQFMPAMELDTAGVSAALVDSVKLVMRIPPMGFTGDSIAPMRATVYRLTTPLPDSLNSSFNPLKEGYCTENDVFGSVAYSATALGMGDSLYNNYERQVEVPLPVSWGRDLYRKYIESPATFASPTEFAKWFPGVYVANSYGSGRVMHITSTVVSLFYRKHTKTSEGNDTIVNTRSDYLATTPEVMNNNNIRLTYDQSITDRLAAGEVLIQAPVGLDATIKLPVKEIVDSFMTARGKNLGILNNVYMNIPAEDIINDANITPPPYLLLVKTSAKDAFFNDNKVTNDVTSYYSTYNSITKSYEFSELRSYVIDLIDKIDEDNYTLTDDDEDFSLVPVNITFDTDYYGSSYVINVIPWVDAPVMCKLNLDEVKLRVAFSVQKMEQLQ